MYSADDGVKRPVYRFGNPRVEVCWRLTAAYRSLLRPSSATNAKASTVCPLLLEKLNSIKQSKNQMSKNKN